MTWDKSKPAGSQKIRLSDDEIRANWAALEDALGRDHNFPGTEGVDAGEHNWVTLREQSAKPSTGANKYAVYAKDDGHLYFVDSDGNERRVWHSGNDGSGSGLDADTVDGSHASAFADTSLSNVSDSTVLNKVKNVDGNGSGLDADLIRGLAGDFTHSFNTNGYQKLPGGLIIQWGRNSIGGGNPASKNVSFPISFPHACLAVVSIPIGSTNGGGDEDFWGINNISTTGFTQYNQYDGSYNFYWIAIGY